MKEGIELSDGGIILYPDNSGAIERWDGTGDRMETRHPDHPDYEEWNRLMGDRAWKGDEEE